MVHGSRWFDGRKSSRYLDRGYRNIFQSANSDYQPLIARDSFTDELRLIHRTSGPHRMRLRSNPIKRLTGLLWDRWVISSPAKRSLSSLTRLMTNVKSVDGRIEMWEDSEWYQSLAEGPSVGNDGYCYSVMVRAIVRFTLARVKVEPSFYCVRFYTASQVLVGIVQVYRSVTTQIENVNLPTSGVCWWFVFNYPELCIRL